MNATYDQPGAGPADPQAALRRMVYIILICAGTGVMLGRIMAIDAVDKGALQDHLQKQIPRRLDEVEKQWRGEGYDEAAIAEKLARKRAELEERAVLHRPFLSANDRSRWCTARALVEPELRVEGAPYAIDKVIQLNNWDTIDMVKHDGHLYSSKPPLFPTLLAAQYWVLYNWCDLKLGDPRQQYVVGRILLVTTNLIPLVIYFWLLSRLIERFGQTDFAKVFAMAAAVFATFLSTFVVVINNHLPGTVCVLAALYAAVRIWFDGERRLQYFAVAGFFSFFAVAFELPAAAFLAALGAALLWKAWRPTLLAFVPGVLAVAIPFFVTNWIAHGSLKPAYFHRTGENSWYDYTYERNGRTIESYWRNPVGVDRGEPSTGHYAFHVLIGHHGIFSLTPISLLAFWGMGLWLWQRGDPKLRDLAILTAVLSVVVIVYYITQPQVNRNYAGISSGLRWLFWLSPLWLLTMLPALDRMARFAWARGVALAMLVVSILSASYPTWNPFTHPWAYNFYYFLGYTDSLR